MKNGQIIPVRVAAVLATVLALTGCGGGSESVPQKAPPSTPAASVSAAAGATTAAACDEVNRLSRQDLDSLSDPDPAHWGTFAISLQGVANASADAGFRQALTDMATAALTVSDDLAAGTSVGTATAGFLDAVPAVDSLCKAAGIPLV